MIHFTDNRHNIPDEHRGRAERIRSIAPPRPSRNAGRPLYAHRATIPLKRRGQTAVIQALVNDRVRASLILDTGATYTVISRSTAKELEIDLESKHPTIRLNTANGTIAAPLVALDSLEVEGMRVDNLTAAVHDFSQDKSIGGLLGLNYLSHFRMDLDAEKGVLILEEK